LAGFSSIVFDFIVEDWVVKGQTKSDWVGGF
jgi:hypothetical protein